MINTKDIPTGGTGGTPKTLQPGNRTIKINSIYLEKFPFGTDAYNLMLDCEGPDLGEKFEGFFVDKDNESLGRHKGQVGRVRASQWAYESKTLSGDIEINRDAEIAKFLKNFAVATGCLEWFEGEDGKHETIESLVTEMNDKAPFKDKFIYTCLGGREYENKAGYTNYDLFFPKFTRDAIPFEDSEVEHGESRVYKYNADTHIIAKKVKEVDNFAGNEASKKDFELG